MSRVYNFGSLNFDHVYRVPAFVRPGETLASERFTTGCGGKGLNQSLALARAGARVAHLGCVGPDGAPLVELLARDGVDITGIRPVAAATGHAIIQVDPAGQNAIVLHAGANRAWPAGGTATAFAAARPGEWFLCQNETNATEAMLAAARACGLTTVFNPAPFDSRAHAMPLGQIDWLVLNETEAQAWTGEADAEAAARVLLARAPALRLVLTRGAEGALYADRDRRHHQPAWPTPVVDTTAAGDTFIGYLLAALVAGDSTAAALHRAAAAAALCVGKAGAAESIPTHAEVAGLSARVAVDAG